MFYKEKSKVFFNIKIYTNTNNLRKNKKPQLGFICIDLKKKFNYYFYHLK